MGSVPPDTDGLGMIWWSARHPPADPKTSFSGKTILITGANVGLGFEAALKFAKLGASRLVLGVRSLARGEEAKAEICHRTGYNSQDVRLYELDMSMFKSVQDFAREVSIKEPCLDVAILNAGIAAPSYKLSPEGYEMTLQINVISTALLAILLFPCLQNSARKSHSPAHLQFVGSVAHRSVEIDAFNLADDSTRILDLINQESFFRPERQYAISKLLLMYIMDNLIEATSSSLLTSPSTPSSPSIPNPKSYPNVTITTVCPGLCRTNLGRDFSSLLRIPMSLFQLMFARTAEQGSRSIISGVTLGQEAHGEFWSHDVFYRKGEMVLSEEGQVLGKKVWKEVMCVIREYAADGKGVEWTETRSMEGI